MFGNGELIEFDTLQALLSNPDSHFISLLEQTGPAKADYLRTLENAAAAKMKLKEQKIATGEELPLDSNEKNTRII